MRILIAPDKFKGSLTSAEVCDAIETGLKKILPDAEYVKFPLADGGEGTTQILTYHLNGKSIKVKAHDPLKRPVDCSYGLSQDNIIALIEMASASGLHLLSPPERSPMLTTTWGTGELIKDAIERGAKQIILGIGGSATNDAGIGAAHALGFEFLDENGRPVNPVGENLVKIRKIKSDKVYPRLKEIAFTAICDVTNPFFGPRGAAVVYGAQKGATPQQIGLLDDGLRCIAHVMEADLGVNPDEVAGAGAGGGFGGGAFAFFNASLKKGIDVVFEITRFEEEVNKADVVITGEGKLDEQTLHGKLVAGVADIAKKFNKQIICVVGNCALSQKDIDRLGFSNVFSLVDHADTERAIQQAFPLLTQIASDQIAPVVKS